MTAKRKVSAFFADNPTALKAGTNNSKVTKLHRKQPLNTNNNQEKACGDAVPKVTPFQQRVYNLISTIPCGHVSTYKGVAQKLNPPSGARAVGNALRRNPFAPVVPCHRVVASDRTMGGFKGEKAPSGLCIKEKISLLKAEGVKFETDGRVAETSLYDWKDSVGRK